MEFASDVLSLSYDATKKAIRTTTAFDLVNMMLSNIATIDFDEIAVTYGATTDAFALKKATVLVATLTVTYADATKAVASKVVRS